MVINNNNNTHMTQQIDNNWDFTNDDALYQDPDNMLITLESPRTPVEHEVTDDEDEKANAEYDKYGDYDMDDLGDEEKHERYEEAQIAGMLKEGINKLKYADRRKFEDEDLNFILYHQSEAEYQAKRTKQKEELFEMQINDERVKYKRAMHEQKKIMNKYNEQLNRLDEEETKAIQAIEDKYDQMKENALHEYKEDVKIANSFKAQYILGNIEKLMNDYAKIRVPNEKELLQAQYQGKRNTINDRRRTTEEQIKWIQKKYDDYARNAWARMAQKEDEEVRDKASAPRK